MNKQRIAISYTDEYYYYVDLISDAHNISSPRKVDYDSLFENIEECRRECPELIGKDVLDIRIKLPIDKDLDKFWEKLKEVFNLTYKE